jgi:hypothetical protein
MNIVGLKQADVDALNLQAKGDSVLATRLRWYQNELDVLYFKEQRGEVPSGTWTGAVADMKAANPWPDGYTSPTTVLLASIATLHNQLAGKSQVTP